MIPKRVLVWFSCGAASACAAKLTLEKYPDAEILYCDTLAYEHEDNVRFIKDCEKWFGREIKFLRSEEYKDIYDVFDKTGWLVGHGMAKCTHYLKRDLRQEYQDVGDLHVFGMSIEEQKRITRFEEHNVELDLYWPLREAGMTKQDCIDMILSAGIEIPAMYRLGYKNNNCIGCVKYGKGYWNKIREDFPESFDRMAKQERKMGVSMDKHVYLDEMPRGVGRYESELNFDCGVTCEIPEDSNV